MTKASKTEYAILGMLSIAPMSGYDIRKTIQSSTANFWAESYGQLYPALARLLKQGLIRADTPEDHADKKVYHLSEMGMDTLKAWLLKAPEKQMIRSEFLLKLFFGANIEPLVSLDHIKAEAYENKNRLVAMQEKKIKLAEEHKDSKHLQFWLMTLEYGIHIAEAKVKWCEAMMKNLGEK